MATLSASVSLELDGELELGEERPSTVAERHVRPSALCSRMNHRRCPYTRRVAFIGAVLSILWGMSWCAEAPGAHEVVFRDFHAPAVTLASVDDLVSINRDMHLEYCSIPPLSEPPRNWTKWIHEFTPITCPTNFAHNITRRMPKGDLVQFHPDGRPPLFTIHPKITGRPLVRATADKPSIAFVFIDAVSRANFFRTFPKTREWLRAQMNKHQAFTFGGHVALHHFTYANWYAFMGGINCAFPGYGFVWSKYCVALGELAAFIPSNTYLWDHAQSTGMRTSVFDYGREFPPLDDATTHDHYLNSDALTGDLKTIHRSADGYMTCVGNVENDRLGLQYQEAVHKAYDHSGQRVFSVTNLVACHQGDRRMGMIVDDQLQSFIETLATLSTPTSVLLLGDHGSQWASEPDMQSERYMPLAVLTIPSGTNPQTVHTLESNQRAITTHADVHATILGMIDPTARPLHDRWPWGLAMPWQRSMNLMLAPLPHRTPAELAIYARMHPCVLPWTRSKRRDGDAEVVSATNFVVLYINSIARTAGAHICRPLRVARIDYTTIQTNVQGGGAGGQMQMRLQMELETVATAGAPQHTVRYDATIARLSDYCLTTWDCFWDAWRPGQYAWSIFNVEPLTTYAKYEGCMGDAIRTSANKRYCVCD
eukprot:GEMP01016442.1.p1 GENE.GEMP01016442.1~~GEMP01016442.1.p1  ORF type:complete len:652 (+),score=144.19 GEMP01016442.1:126-2081(+)